jgi:hypothetical protein
MSAHGKPDKIKIENSSIPLGGLMEAYERHNFRIVSLLGNISDGKAPDSIKQMAKLSIIATIIGLDSVMTEMTTRLSVAAGAKPVYGYASLVDALRKALGGAVLSRDQLDDLKLLRAIRNTFAHKINMTAEFDLFFGKNSPKTLLSYFSELREVFIIMNTEVSAIENQLVFNNCEDFAVENKRKIAL